MKTQISAINPSASEINAATLSARAGSEVTMRPGVRCSPGKSARSSMRSPRQRTKLAPSSPRMRLNMAWDDAGARTLHCLLAPLQMRMGEHWGNQVPIMRGLLSKVMPSRNGMPLWALCFPDGYRRGVATSPGEMPRRRAAMSSRHKFNSSYEFHPEFGYLCPSRQLRQNVRVGLAAAGFGIILGLVGAMMLVPRHYGNPARTESTLAVAPPDTATESPPAPPAFTDAPAPPPATAPSVLPATPAEPAVSTDRVGQLPPSALPPARQGPGTAKVTSTEPPPAAEEEKPCTEETWPYFDSKCLWGPAR